MSWKKINVDQEDCDRFDEFFKKRREAGKDTGKLRQSDGWARKFKYLVDHRINEENLDESQVRKSEAEVENLKKRVSRAENMADEAKSQMEMMQTYGKEAVKKMKTRIEELEKINEELMFGKGK